MTRGEARRSGTISIPSANMGLLHGGCSLFLEFPDESLIAASQQSGWEYQPCHSLEESLNLFDPQFPPFVKWV